jgi:hypothetical protein
VECDPAAARSSARSGQYRLDTPVRGRFRRKLLERLVEKDDRLLAMASAALNEAEIVTGASCSSSPSARRMRSACPMFDGIPGSATSERETEVVARERLTPPVT